MGKRARWKGLGEEDYSGRDWAGQRVQLGGIGREGGLRQEGLGKEGRTRWEQLSKRGSKQEGLGKRGGLDGRNWTREKDQMGSLEEWKQVDWRAEPRDWPKGGGDGLKD